MDRAVRPELAGCRVYEAHKAQDQVRVGLLERVRERAQGAAGGGAQGAGGAEAAASTGCWFADCVGCDMTEGFVCCDRSVSLSNVDNWSVMNVPISDDPSSVRTISDISPASA